MTITQILLVIFLLFAFSRVFLRFKGGVLSVIGFIFWSVLFGLATIGVIFPFLTTNLAKTLGIGRGVDAVLYISIVLLYYLVFRIYVYLEDIKHDITELVQKLALKDNEKSSHN